VATSFVDVKVVCLNLARTSDAWTVELVGSFINLEYAHARVREGSVNIERGEGMLLVMLVDENGNSKQLCRERWPVDAFLRRVEERPEWLFPPKTNP
jgi:hypothetical protein